MNCNLGCSNTFGRLGYLYDADGFVQFPFLIRVSRAHFRSESFQGFIYLDKIQHFVHEPGDF